MRILTALTYYLPHISGLTVFASRLNRLLADDGYDVTVLTSRFAPALATHEVDSGTRVVRSPVFVRVSKGVVMPLFPWHAFQQVRKHDLVYLHLPQLEASVLAIFARLMRKPVVVQYQCDVVLPSRRARFLFALPIRLSHELTCRLADRIVVITEDYARHSTSAPDTRAQHGLGNGPLIGFVGRLAEEKGIDTLLEALTLVREMLPDARLVIVGPTDAVPGERRARARLLEAIEARGEDVVHVGVLSDEELVAFYRAIDVLAVPSTNSTESFGLTQAEAMLVGTPAVASDLPGVREAVRATGMGENVTPGDPTELAGALIRVLRSPERYARPPVEVRALFDPSKVARFYAELFDSLAPGVARTREASVTAAGEDRPVLPAKRS
jgi:glycosyltransferase involved in cell wall biosynthesis